MGVEACSSCKHMDCRGDVSAEPDLINHPPHYETGRFECIEVMEEVMGREAVRDFCLCNAFKYLFRCRHKHEDPREDVEKADWYLKKYLDMEDDQD